MESVYDISADTLICNDERIVAAKRIDYRLCQRRDMEASRFHPLRKSERSIGRRRNSLEILGFLYAGQRERDRREGFNLSCRKARLMQTLWSPRSISTDLRFGCLNGGLKMLGRRRAYVPQQICRLDRILLRFQWTSLEVLLRSRIITRLSHSTYFL